MARQNLVMLAAAQMAAGRLCVFTSMDAEGGLVAGGFPGPYLPWQTTQKAFATDGGLLCTVTFSLTYLP